VSIASNIAEGSSRASDTDFLRFLEIAYRSLMEVVTQARIAQRQHFLQDSDHEALVRHAEQLARMLSGLRTSLLPKPSN
jgi:four helix bundle protein